MMVFMAPSPARWKTLKRMDKGGSMSRTRPSRIAAKIGKPMVSCPSFSLVMGNPPDSGGRYSCIQQSSCLRRGSNSHPASEIIMHDYTISARLSRPSDLYDAAEASVSAFRQRLTSGSSHVAGLFTAAQFADAVGLHERSCSATSATLHVC